MTNRWRMLWTATSLLFAGWEILYLAAGVLAATLAWRGADRIALLVLAAVCSATLYVLPPLSLSQLTSDWGVTLALTSPVILAAGLTAVGLPLLRGGPIAIRVPVVALIAFPLVKVVLTQAGL